MRAKGRVVHQACVQNGFDAALPSSAMPLTYRDRGTSGTQLDVLSGSIVICSLRKAMQSTDTRGERWEWSWQISKDPPGFRVHDSADTKPEAQVMLESEWQAWLDAAGLTEAV